MKAYKIFLNGTESVLNAAKGNIDDPYAYYEGTENYAFSNGRTAQKVVNDHKRNCVQQGLMLEGLQFQVIPGEFVPYEVAE